MVVLNRVRNLKIYITSHRVHKVWGSPIFFPIIFIMYGVDLEEYLLEGEQIRTGLIKATLICLLITSSIAGLGLYLDIVWHHNIPFESFWSPAHIILYSGVFGSALLLLIASRLEGWNYIFGSVRNIRFLPGLVYPQPLFIAALGTLIVLIAGAIDERWHSILGGGESAYSWPHNLALSGGVILGFAVVSIINSVKTHHKSITMIGWVLLSISFPIVLYRYIGYLVLPYSYIEELVKDPILSGDVAWLEITENILRYNVSANNYIFSPFAFYLMTIIFLYPISTLNLSSSHGIRYRFLEYPILSSILIYIGSRYLFDYIMFSMGYRVLWFTHIAASLIILGLLYDVSRRLLNIGDLYIWIFSVIPSSLIYMLMLGYEPTKTLFGVIGAIFACISSIYITRYILSSIEDLDEKFIVSIIVLVVIIPLVLGSVDSFLRYGVWVFPPTP